MSVLCASDRKMHLARLVPACLLLSLNGCLALGYGDSARDDSGSVRPSVGSVATGDGGTLGGGGAGAPSGTPGPADGGADAFVDACPNDDSKSTPGVCGCGTPDQDLDGNGMLDCLDACPTGGSKEYPGQCGCQVPDTDTDADGIADCNDACPMDPNKQVAGLCGCGAADDDTDADGIADCNDACPMDGSKVSLGVCGCGVLDTDSDGDGSADCIDLCPTDPTKDAPGVCGCGIEDCSDSDGDGVGDSTESACGSDPSNPDSVPTDVDGDGVCDALDQCQGTDAVGDSDMDGVCDDWETLWASAAVPPHTAGGASSAVLSDGLHYLGGDVLDNIGENTSQMHWVYTADGDWMSAREVPDGATLGAHAHVYQDKLYLLGGRSNDDLFADRFRSYDPSTDQWTILQGPEMNVYSAATGVLGDALYAFGGAVAKTSNAPGVRYDFQSQTWADVAATLPENAHTYAQTSAVVGTKLYVLNGGNGPAAKDSTLLQIYDSVTDSWSVGPPLQGHFYEGAAAAVWGTRVYFFGGADDQDGTRTIELSNTVNIYDTVNEHWLLGPPMPTPSMWSTAQLFQGEFHVLGGFDSVQMGLQLHLTVTP